MTDHKTGKERFERGVRDRLSVRRGRPEGTARFPDKYSFVATCLYTVFTYLDSKQAPIPKRIPMEKIGLDIFGHTDGRLEFRRHLQRFQLNWPELLSKALEAYEMKAFPEKLIP